MARLALALVQLRDEVNAAAPGRSKASDGWIGDAKHRARSSRHNPNNAGVVCALDITDDPAGGCPIHEWAEQIRQRPQLNLEYIISNGRVAAESTGWAWHRYTGSNPHRAHVHFAVGEGPDSKPRPPYDDRDTWGIAAVPAPAPAPSPAPAEPGAQFTGAITGWMNAVHPAVREGDQSDTVAHLQVLLGGLKADGAFGPRTRARLVAIQQTKGLTVDGIAGDQTWGNIHPHIRQGDNGETVKEAQRSLIGLNPDGDFGPLTDAAVRAYQRSRGLVADGIVGEWSWETLCRDG